LLFFIFPRKLYLSAGWIRSIDIAPSSDPRSGGKTDDRSESTFKSIGGHRMMGKPSIWLFLGILLFVFIGNASEHQNAIWKGHTEVENGIKIISNPNEPLYGKIVFELQEDLSIGNQSDTSYSFNLISDVKTDMQGNIYVVDTRNLRVQIFDHFGSFLKSMTKGIASFQQPYKIRFDSSSGNIFIRTSVQDIEIFNIKDNNWGHIHLENACFYDYEPIQSDRVIAVRSVEYHDNNPRVMLTLVGAGSHGEMKPLANEYFYYALQKVEEGYTADSFSFSPVLFLSKLNENLFIFGHSGEYRLDVIDKEGKIAYRFTKDEPVPVSTSKERKAFKKYGVPDHKPYFFNLMTDSKGRVYIQRNISKVGPYFAQENFEKDVDIFSADGIFLYTSTLPANTCEIKNGLLYAFAADGESGLETVKRYKIKNWGQLK
jgi:hypothetical protein